MRSLRIGCMGVIVFMAFSGGHLGAQTVSAKPPTDASAPQAVPRLVQFGGQLLTGAGKARSGSVMLTISLYKDQTGEPSLWSEQQVVTLDAAGRYSVILGTRTNGGIPEELFSGSTARWLGVRVEAEEEQPRVMLLSFPYALKAADADTLGGKTLSQFVLTENLQETLKSTSRTGAAAIGVGDPGSLVSTVGRIAKFSDTANTTVDSNIFEVAASGNIGIGTTNPQSLLELSGAGKELSLVDGASNAAGQVIRYKKSRGTVGAPTIVNNGDIVGQFNFMGHDGAAFQNAAMILGMVDGAPAANNMPGRLSFLTTPSGSAVSVERMRIDNQGNVGLGTTNPMAMLDMQGAGKEIMFTDGASNGAGAVIRYRKARGSISLPALVNSGDILGQFNFMGFDGTSFQNAGMILGVTEGTPSTNNMPGRIAFLTTPNGSTISVERMRINSAGFVGIGTTTPSTMLHVAGSVTVDGNIGAKYQDVAEWVESSVTLEPGTVVIVDPKQSNKVLPAPRAYDTRVAGAVSRQPGLVLGEKSDDKAMVAQSGRVKVKVDAKYGAIRIGDLLVTSPTPGYAMRSRPMKVGGQALHRPGTLLGKALEPLPSGKGEILVLLTLQ
jgi:hypothetical protein